MQIIDQYVNEMLIIPIINSESLLILDDAINER